MARQSFEAWMAEVDRVIGAKTGLSSGDLADVCYVDWYEDGMGPRSAACKAIRADQGGDE